MLALLPFAIFYFFPEIKNIFQTIQERNARSEDQGLVIKQGGFLSGVVTYLGTALRNLISIIREYFHSPVPLAYALLATGTALLCSFSGTYLLSLKLGLDVHFYEVVFISVIVNLFTLIPISLNGIGIRELIMTTLYVSLGTTFEQASMLAILTRILMTLMTMIGSIWLPQLLSGIKLDQIKLNLKFEGFNNRD